MSSINKISICKVIFEDHSAKTFLRPEWKKYLADLRKHKGQADLVLFLKWDRFSRNAGDAYQMINTLRKLGVEPQAIEQPLDLSIPENKMMLAFYLAAPEVENDRRALNVLHGMRRAKIEGRYMGKAPFGYINKTNERGRKVIEPIEPAASIMRWAFEKVAEEEYNIEQIFKMALQKGFERSKNAFWMAIRNPIYCGKIFVSKYKDEAAQFVSGLHESIVPEELFYQVQDVLDGRKRHFRPKVISDESLPLRGFLICPKCGKLLTGSRSKGHTKYYTYYHCSKGCSCRYRADNVNNVFLQELKKYIPKKSSAIIYKNILVESWNKQGNNLQNEYRQLSSEVKKYEDKLSYIRELLSSKEIDPGDFREMKAEYNSKLERLEAKLTTCKLDQVNIGGLLEEGLENLLKLDYAYITGDIEKKRQIISSIFPEKLTFDGNAVRTNRVNEAILLIYKMDKGFRQNKKGQSGHFPTLSRNVARTRIELVSRV